jgi:pentatricopeptide repeat protein
MAKFRGFFSLFVPTATVFTSSFCIMVLELVASRLIARHLGSSLYTWTSVIGVVLAGITIGNYLGGRIADKYPARKALAVLFGISSATCVTTVILNNLVGDWIWLWQFSWPIRVFTHVTLVFLLPSILLGTISPVVAKMALERGFSTGRTIGDIYAWGAAGSIAGTFVAGFYLIAAMGTVAIIWTVAAVLLVMAILYMVRFWPLYIWAIIFLCALLLAASPLSWCKTTGAALALRQPPDSKIIYENETQYCHVAVERASDTADIRTFTQDTLVHSEINMNNMTALRYAYEQIYAALTHRFARNNNFSALIIGGGGYVFPRYLEKIWPGSHVEVVEIDPGVTQAAIKAFGLEESTPIKISHMDGRNYIDELLEKKRSGQHIRPYNFIYEDALNDYSVPYQLTTKEFDDKLASLLTADGLYMVEMIDMYDSALFLGSFVNTLQKTFPYVYVVTEADQWHSDRNTFVLVAAKRQLDLTNLKADYTAKNLDLWLLNESEVKGLKEKASCVVLTDDYAPVENLLAPTVLKTTQGFIYYKYIQLAQEFQKQGKIDKAVAEYEKALRTVPAVSLPSLSIEIYNSMAKLYSENGRLEEAAQTLRRMLQYNQNASEKQDMSTAHYNLGVTLKKLGRTKEAVAENNIAIAEYHKDLEKDPNSIIILLRLGDALASYGRYLEAAQYFKQAVALDPNSLPINMSLIRAFEYGGNVDSAIDAAQRAIKFFSLNKQEKPAAQLQQYLALLELKKSKNQKISN